MTPDDFFRAAAKVATLTRQIETADDAALLQLLTAQVRNTIGERDHVDSPDHAVLLFVAKQIDLKLINRRAAEARRPLRDVPWTKDPCPVCGRAIIVTSSHPDAQIGMYEISPGDRWSCHPNGHTGHVMQTANGFRMKQDEPTKGATT